MISTGSKHIDNFLKGYPKNLLTIIYGEAGTGKTTLVLLASLEQAKNNKKVIFIDTENSFNIERIAQLEPNYKNILNNIILISPKSFKEQEKIILNLTKKTNLIIIDTISKFYRKELRENKNKITQSLIKQVQKLIHLTRESIPVIITSQVYSNMENEIIPVGGQMLKNWAKLLIKLEKEPIRKLIQEKPEKKEFKFEIKSSGIFSL